MKIATHSPRLASLAIATSLTLIGTSLSQAAVYTWISSGNPGQDSNLDVAANWSLSGPDAGTDPTTPSASSSQLNTNSADDVIIFDSTNYSTTPRNIYTRSTSKWGSIQVLNGTINWQNDSNNSGNYSYTDGESGTPTMVVGNGNATADIANLNIINWNHDGTNGTKTYLVNSDGLLASARGGNHVWSNGANLDTVMRLVGGAVNITGQFFESHITGDAGDYVSFEDFGSTFTFTKGDAAGKFDDALDITNAFGDSFRLGGSLNSGNAALGLTDGGSTWTIGITAIPEPEPALLGSLGLLLLLRRRR